MNLAFFLLFLFLLLFTFTFTLFKKEKFANFFLKMIIVYFGVKFIIIKSNTLFFHHAYLNELRAYYAFFYY